MPESTDDRGKPWTELYQAALLELEPARLELRIEAARQAIQQRLTTLGNDGGFSDERQSLDDAERTLRLLSRRESR